MCKGGGGGRQPDPPKPRPPQVLRNPYLDERVGLANRGIGALTMRAGDRVTVSEEGTVGPVRTAGELAMGSAQGSGEFTELTFGASNRASLVYHSAAERRKRKAEARARRRDRVRIRDEERGK